MRISTPTTSRTTSLGLGLLALLLASACAGPPKVMTSHQYLAENRSAKTLLQESGAARTQALACLAGPSPRPARLSRNALS